MLGLVTSYYRSSTEVFRGPHKSTPTTRTLDQYVSLDLCPKNPRSKRVVDTAEFVLRHLPDKDSPACGQLRQALDEFRHLLSGVKPKSPQSDG